MVVIVEGKNDYNKIKSIYPHLDILITNGSAISDEFLNLVNKVSEKKEIVLCLDPDFAGEKIRKRLLEVVPDAHHIFPNRSDAISKNGKKVGVEHMTTENIKKVFSNIKTKTNGGSITNDDLLKLGLVGCKGSRIKREQLGKRLGIGYTNSKQMLNRLNMFNISYKEIVDNL